MPPAYQPKPMLTAFWGPSPGKAANTLSATEVVKSVSLGAILTAVIAVLQVVAANVNSIPGLTPATALAISSVVGGLITILDLIAHRLPQADPTPPGDGPPPLIRP